MAEPTRTPTEQELFDRGYEAGFEGNEKHITGEPHLLKHFKDGYKLGKADRKEVDKSGSSNT